MQFKLYMHQKKSGNKKKIPVLVWLLTLISICAHGQEQAKYASLTDKVDFKPATANATDLLEALQKQTSYAFTFEKAELQKVKLQDLHFKQVPLGNVLQHLETEEGLLFFVSNHHIAVSRNLMFKKATAPTQRKGPGIVAGRIIDEENGQPLSGVTVRIADKGTTTTVNGTFSISLPEGNYAALISYVGYATKEVSDISVMPNQTFSLNVTMKKAKGQLEAFVVKASAQKESIASLFIRQKNAIGLSDGISAEQISATPDKHIGETLKRITGVSTNDNRKVVVRGISERYNIALLDGSTLPSTDVQERDFEFNLIPTNLVENIVISKSITPDMIHTFAGGLVQITTKSIPTSNFLTLSAGISINNRTVGQDFMGYQRGKNDYWGFDDGGRNHFPKDMFNFVDKYNPRLPDDQNEVNAPQIGAQNKRIGGTERLGARTYTGMPSQNYQVTLGRAYSLSKTKTRSLGFVGSLTYRNTQSNDHITDMRRGNWSHNKVQYWDEDDVNTGHVYGFNTTLGVLLNGGFKTDKHQITTNNLYTHIFEDRFSRIIGWNNENTKDDAANRFPFVEEDDRPKYSDLLQNKISGTHQLGRIKLNWNMNRTILNTLEQDAVTARLASAQFANKAPLYQYYPQQASDPGFRVFHRDQYTYKERNLGGDISAAYDFKIGNTSHTFKTGFNIMDKHAWYDWLVLPIVTVQGFNNPYKSIPVQEWGNYMSMNKPLEDLFYYPGTVSRNGFEGKSITKGGFAMLDSRLLPNLRIVGGIRGEYFRTDTLRNGANLHEDVNMKLYMDDSVRTFWLPSANITYTPFKNFNIRVAYAESVVRPGLMENARFARYSPNYGTVLRSRGVVTTHIQNYDAKLEWFPGAGEIISVGYFYKYFDKPAEYYAEDVAQSNNYSILITNSDWAKVKGWEFEMRKNLGFLNNNWGVLKNIYVSGNLTLQESTVRARVKHIYTDVAGKDSVTFTYLKYPRALYGQVPLLYNLGIQYSGSRLGLNLAYNYMDYKTFMTSNKPDGMEYERPRAQLDGQITYKLLKGKMEAKLNISNILDAPYRFFINTGASYELKPGGPFFDAEWADAYQYKSGFSEKFEEGYVDKAKNAFVGDRKTLTRYVGTTFSFSLSYKF